MSGTEEADCNLFKNVKYKISGVVKHEVTDLLKDGGGQGFSYFSDYVTHCIVGDEPYESDVIDANDLYEVPVVTSNWVILSAKCRKLLPCKGFTYGEDQLFSGVVCCLSEVSTADVGALWVMINYYGGKCSNILTNSTTHLVVGRCAGRKYDRAIGICKESHGRIHLVAPDWVVNSVKGGTRCNEILYHPRLLMERHESTAYITGIVADKVPLDKSTTVPVCSNELLEELKQRMPWNQSSSSPVSTLVSDAVLKEDYPKSSSFPTIPPIILADTIPQPHLQQTTATQREPHSVSPKIGHVQQRTIRTKAGHQRQLLHVDAQTHAKLQQMDPEQRALFVKTLKEQRQQQQHQTTHSMNVEQSPRITDLALQLSQVKCQQTENAISVQSDGTHPSQIPMTGFLDCAHSNNEISKTTQIASVASVPISKIVQYSRTYDDVDTQNDVNDKYISKDSSSDQGHSMDVEHHTRQEQLNQFEKMLQSSQRQSCLSPRRSTLGNLNISAVRNAHVTTGIKTPYKLTSSRIATIMTRTISPQRSKKPDAQFFGHNSNLKLPPDKCLLGCIFFIVEYDQKGYDTYLWQRIIEENGGEIEKSYSSTVTHVLCQTQKHPLVQQGLRDCKRCVTADWLSDTALKQRVRPPCLALHFPTPFSDEKPCSNLIITYSGFECEERIRVKKMIDAVGAKTTNYSSKHDILVCGRPYGDEYKKAREWAKSVVNVQWLNAILLGHYSCLQQVNSEKYQQFDVEDPFQIDYTLIPHLMAAWKTPINLTQETYDKIEMGNPLIHKRKRQRLSNSTSILDTDEENQIIFPDVSPNRGPSLNNKPHVIFSGIMDVCEEEKKVRLLGGIVVKDFRKATHLIINKPQRTFKFLCCLSIIKHIVTIDWLLDSYDQSMFLDEPKYCVSGSELEMMYDFSISNLLRNPERSRLFKGKTFYITPGVVPSPSALSEIIVCAGGAVDKQRKSLKQIQKFDPLSYLIITVKNDLHLIGDVVRANIGVYNSEFVISALFKQKIDYSCAVKLNRSKNQ